MLISIFQLFREITASFSTIKKMRLFKRKYHPDYDYLISKLKKGDSNDIQQMLWQPQNKKIDYLPISTDLIRELQKDNSKAGTLTIYKQIQKGRFELLIFKTFETTDKMHFSPLIIDKETCKIVGIMLLFNELYGYFSKKENKEITELGIAWTKFITNG